VEFLYETPKKQQFKGRPCFAEGLSPAIASAIADLTLFTDRNGKISSIVATVGKNPSAKGFHLRLSPTVFTYGRLP
jgi:hypothetical protein